uniref:Uncharacterized protein n=1 Tax=uncultured prokaryote TaxID=198431 RepID=A0A0H5Q502_9ZZZZ|nr:hypothetical protein [uncultured prokaryote]
MRVGGRLTSGAGIAGEREIPTVGDLPFAFSPAAAWRTAPRHTRRLLRWVWGSLLLSPVLPRFLLRRAGQFGTKSSTNFAQTRGCRWSCLHSSGGSVPSARNRDLVKRSVRRCPPPVRWSSGWSLIRRCGSGPGAVPACSRCAVRRVDFSAGQGEEGTPRKGGTLSLS